MKLQEKKITSEIEHEMPHLRSFARYLAKNTSDADDLVQECLVRAIANQHQYQPGTNLRAWLTTILRNAFYNTCRKRKREREALSEQAIAADQKSAPNQEDVIALHEVQSAWTSLSPNHRKVLTMIGIEGMSYQEVAKRTGVSVGTVKSRTSRARHHLSEITARAA